MVFRLLFTLMKQLVQRVKNDPDFLRIDPDFISMFQSQANLSLSIIFIIFKSSVLSFLQFTLGSLLFQCQYEASFIVLWISSLARFTTTALDIFSFSLSLFRFFRLSKKTFTWTVKENAQDTTDQKSRNVNAMR